MKVLVVDDNRDDREQLQQHLEGVGYKVVTAESGIDALKVLAQQQFRLILTDWSMPGMSGLELISKIRQHQGSHYAFIILLSDRDSQRDIMRGIACGADDYVVLPLLARLGAEVKATEKITPWLLFELGPAIAFGAGTDSEFAFRIWVGSAFR